MKTLTQSGTKIRGAYKKIPMLNLMTIKDMEKVQDFFQARFNNRNTCTTYLAMIASIIKYALKKGIVNNNPLPEHFRGSFEDGDREVLNENDCIKIMELNDNLLTHTQQVAKYSLLVQMLTGIGYKDLKNLEHSNLLYDDVANQYIIEGVRTKTQIKYIVNLTVNGKYHVDKLEKLTGNTEKLFVLPSIEYAIRLYKVIGRMAGVTTSISTYTLRHTFAVDFMDSGGKMEDLKVRLGHKDIKTTQIYGKISAKRNAKTTRDLETNSRIHQLTNSGIIGTYQPVSLKDIIKNYNYETTWN